MAFLVLHYHFLGEHYCCCLLSWSEALYSLKPGPAVSSCLAGLGYLHSELTRSCCTHPALSAALEQSVLQMHLFCFRLYCASKALKELLSNAAESECIHSVLMVLTHNYFIFF